MVTTQQMILISQCSDVTLTLISQYSFAIFCVQQSFIITKSVNATKECWIHIFDLKKKGMMLHFFKSDLNFNIKITQYVHIFNYTSVNIYPTDSLPP